MKIMTKKRVDSWIRQIDKHVAVIENERDALDAMITKLQDLEEVCIKAHDALIEARDALSEIV
jgi:exonuclease VII small subunit